MVLFSLRYSLLNRIIPRLPYVLQRPFLLLSKGGKVAQAATKVVNGKAASSSSSSEDSEEEKAAPKKVNYEGYEKLHERCRSLVRLCVMILQAQTTQMPCST